MADHPDEVLRQQELVRRSGAVNMFDRRGVIGVAEELGHGELAEYVEGCDGATYVEMANESAGQYRGEEL